MPRYDWTAPDRETAESELRAAGWKARPDGTWWHGAALARLKAAAAGGILVVIDPYGDLQLEHERAQQLIEEGRKDRRGILFGGVGSGKLVVDGD